MKTYNFAIVFFLVAFYLVGIALVVTLVAQDKPSTYQPNEVQKLQLENAQLKAKLAQQAWSTKAYQLPEFTQAQQALSNLQAECSKVVEANRWPATVTCNVDTLAFTDNQPPAPATPSKK